MRCVLRVCDSLESGSVFLPSARTLPQHKALRHTNERVAARARVSLSLSLSRARGQERHTARAVTHTHGEQRARELHTQRAADTRGDGRL